MDAKDLLVTGRRVAKRAFRKALPMTADALGVGARWAGARAMGMARRVGSEIGDRLDSSRLMTRARASVGRGIRRTEAWVRRSPYALPLVGLGGAGLALLGLAFRKGKAGRKPSLAKGFQDLRAGSLLQKGWSALLRRALMNAATPREPRVFRALTIRW